MLLNEVFLSGRNKSFSGIFWRQSTTSRRHHGQKISFSLQIRLDIYGNEILHVAIKNLVKNIALY